MKQRLAAWHADFERANGREANEADIAASRALQELQRRLDPNPNPNPSPSPNPNPNPNQELQRRAASLKARMVRV